MGDYTPTQKFYKPDGDELVNVEQDLNYNWRRADERVKALAQIQRTDLPSITTSELPKDVGFKWYLTHTNAYYYYYDNRVVTDSNSLVADWSVTGLSFEPGYGSANLEDSRIAYCIQDGFVFLRGRLVLNGGTSELPVNTTTDFMTLPASARPARAKYFTIYGGNASGTASQCARLYIPASTSSDFRLEFCRYGGSASSSAERYLSLNDAFYGLDD